MRKVRQLRCARLGQARQRLGQRRSCLNKSETTCFPQFAVKSRCHWSKIFQLQTSVHWQMQRWTACRKCCRFYKHQKNGFVLQPALLAFASNVMQWRGGEGAKWNYIEHLEYSDNIKYIEYFFILTELQLIWIQMYNYLIRIVVSRNPSKWENCKFSAN